jgi:drug/metabolite transporter (DMT)-like permease
VDVIGGLLLLIAAVVYVVPSVICGRVARANGLRPVWLWMALGVVFSWFAPLFLAALLAVRPAPRRARPS